MWGALIPFIGTVIDKLFPDAQQAAEGKLKLLEMAQAGELKVLDAELQIAMGQAKVNEVEAASNDRFRGGWRPMAGWVCSVALLYTFLLQPLLAWAAAIQGWPVPPKIDMDTLMGLLTGMLGLGGFRTYERIKGKA
ncbi:holin family protein [Chitinolyticbacter meiyuanensis]|uniref:holin family protein n=1 Tax=Chitinolyticbacter meiyuanensis TaxID=682798 RepID=UPI0011E5C458|nr:holin family protein [Chitinolyticbacter meiyuanensis]